MSSSNHDLPSDAVAPHLGSAAPVVSSSNNGVAGPGYDWGANAQPNTSLDDTGYGGDEVYLRRERRFPLRTVLFAAIVGLLFGCVIAAVVNDAVAYFDLHSVDNVFEWILGERTPDVGTD